MKINTIDLSILIVLLCAGCSEVDKGTVTGKTYKAPWTQTNIMLIGKVAVPQIIKHPERWVIYIEDGGESGYCYVTPAYYKKVNIGDNLDCI